MSDYVSDYSDQFLC